MEHGKRKNNLPEGMNNFIYRDLKDIMREHTLPFLPAKSLFRFTGVCKDWKLRISSPFFAHNQSNSFHNLSGFFYQAPGDPPSFLSLDPKSYGVPDPHLEFLPVPVNIRTSCNGLLCCQGQTDEKAYYICNPVTKQWKKLPQPNGDHGPEPALVLIFEPSLLNFAADYKLVCAFPSTDFDNGYEFEIYSSATGSWTLSGELCFGERKVVPGSGVHVKGTVYWMTTRGHTHRHYTGIVAFDLTKDRSRVIPSYGLKGSLGEMHGSLCNAYVESLMIRVNILSNIYSNTMEMGSDLKMWSEPEIAILENPVDGVNLRSRMSGLLYIDCDVAVIQTEEVIASHDMNAKKTTIMCKTAKDGAKYIPYVNSLVSFSS